MTRGNLRLAVRSLRQSRSRSIMTMFGVIIGVSAVITTMALGEGLKRQVVGQISQLGRDLITIRPGRLVERDDSGAIRKVNIAATYGAGAGSLSEQDLATIKGTAGIKIQSPVSVMQSSAQLSDGRSQAVSVLGVNEKLPELIGQKVEVGSFFDAAEQNRHVAVIGKTVADELFRETAPIGMTLTIRGQDYIVRGVFETFDTTPFGPAIDMNRSIYVPSGVLKEASANNVQILQVLLRPTEPAQTDRLVASLNKSLLAAHGGQSDVTVLKQDENLLVANKVLQIITMFVASVAGIALLVGGVGIMNIMLAAVSERTHEIGIRKAVGATNQQILRQFLTEASVLSVVGGLLGVLVATAAVFLIRVTTNLKPVISWQVCVVAVSVSIAIGLIFGIVPAIKAARKDPIDSLRRA